MKNKKYAFTTTLCDTYIEGFFISFYSLKKTTINFNYDLIIFEWGSLSDENKIKIKKLYDNVFFKKIKTKDYKNCTYDNEIRKWDTFNPNYRFDIFTLSEYEKIIYFDCDIIFEVDMSNLLKDENIKFGACKLQDYEVYNQTIGNNIFNAGLLVIGNIYLNNNIRNDLINLSLSNPPKNTLNCDKKWVGNQPILNNYFLNRVNWLDKKYNLTIDNINNNSLEHENNYHIIGKNKPWMSNDIYKQFDKYVFDKLSKQKNSNMITCLIILKKIIKKYENIKKEIDASLWT